MSVARPPFIYALVDPREPEHVRYVGMTTSNPERPLRHRRHANPADRTETRLARWVRKLARAGVNYRVEILEQLCPGAPRRFVGEREKAHIACGKSLGHDLTNLTPGGDGGATMAGRKLSVESRAKLSASIRASEAHKASRAVYGPKISAIKKGVPLTPEHRAAIAASVTPERRADLATKAKAQCTARHLHKMNEAKRGKPWSAKRRAAQTPEVTAKISAARQRNEPWNKGVKGTPNMKLRGRVFSPETIEKMRAAAKARHQRNRDARLRT